MSNVVIMPIREGSDGDARRWPKHNLVRNDGYHLERVGALWAKDVGSDTADTTYRLDKLPHGYAGFERTRPDSKHVDRYVYGHAKGAFRSMNEFYPHFKYLMDNGNALGCPCKHCNGLNQKKVSSNSAAPTTRRTADQSPSSVQNRQPQRNAALPAAAAHARRPQTQSASNATVAPTQPHQGQSNDTIRPPRPKRVDDEGCNDYLNELLDDLKAVGPQGMIDVKLQDRMSPDWRAGHEMLMERLKEWQSQPAYVPRQGELVLFVRDLDFHETLPWVAAAQTWRVFDTTTMTLLPRPKWEAGVVTQTPQETLDDADLDGCSSTTQTSVVLSGFRVEPLAMPDKLDKSYTKQHKYVPYHATRPLAMWKECVHGLREDDWHVTIRHALTVASSFCLVGRHHFKGAWSAATVFAKGVYIGAELLMVGDAVRLQPRAGEQPPDAVTDILIVTGVRLRLVNLDEASDDDASEGHPYNTCLHISGRAYTLDPKRCFDGVGKAPVDPDDNNLPPGIRELGPWYHMTDPNTSNARLEVPFNRVLGRCHEEVALKAGLVPPYSLAPPALPPQPSQADDTATYSNTRSSGYLTTNLSYGLKGILEAREYSTKHDPRIDSDAGKSWFWADNRVQQLDLHEVNGRPVGRADQRRREQMSHWRRALKMLDGNRTALVEYQQTEEERVAERKRKRDRAAKGGSGLLVAAAAVESETELQSDGGGKLVQRRAEDDLEMQDGNGGGAEVITGVQHLGDVDMDEMDDMDEGDDAADALAQFKGRPQSQGPVVELDDAHAD